MAVRIQMRRDTLTNWSTNNPTLAEGEMGLEKDTGRWKVGNGVDAWNTLSYSNSISGPSSITDNSAGNALRITQLGTGNALVVEDSVNPDSTPFVINSVGNVGIGTASPSVLLDVSGVGNFSGILYAPTASVDTSTTQVATTAFVLNQANSASATITMNGTKSAGSSKLYARADHVHPTDTSRAPLASPSFTGTPTAPTASVNTNTTQVATTAFVLNQANSASATITMNGTKSAGSSNLYARADHTHPIDTSRAPLASPTFTGTPAAPTAVVDTNTTQIATTAFVLAQASGSNPLALGTVAQGTSTRYARQDHVHPTTGLGLTSGKLSQFATTTSAELAGVISDETGSGSLVFASGPSLTGIPTAPTASLGTNTTQIATTQFVANEISSIPSILPSQTGQSGKYLTTNGTSASWGTINLSLYAQLSGAVFTGTTSGISPTANGSNGFRNITMSTSAPTGGNDGDVWLVYT